MIGATILIEAVASHAMASGYFDKVNQYEPKSAPQTNLTASVWIQSFGPAHGQSGLISTTMRFLVNVRIYCNMLQDPPDMIDPSLMEAVDALMSAYSGDFTLDGLVREVDLLGMTGEELGGAAGYIEIDKKMFRVFTLAVPMIVNDVYSQVP